VYLMTLKIGVQDDRGAAHVNFDAEVIGMNTPPIPRQYVGLLGRDFLRVVHLVYNGPKGRVELHLSSAVTGKTTLKHKFKKKKKKH
jgi:hypothetical protein